MADGLNGNNIYRACGITARDVIYDLNINEMA